MSFTEMLFIRDINFFLEMLIPSNAIAATMFGQAVDMHHFDHLLVVIEFNRSLRSFN